MTFGDTRIEARIWAKVEPAESGCWEWVAAKGEGYGRVSFLGSLQPAHRVVYEALVGPIPEGLFLDHLCRNRACVNPAHLEPVTNAENILRGTSPSAVNAVKTHCVHGHALAGANLMVNIEGERVCRTCKALRRARNVDHLLSHVDDPSRPDRWSPGADIAHRAGVSSRGVASGLRALADRGLAERTSVDGVQFWRLK